MNPMRAKRTRPPIKILLSADGSYLTGNTVSALAHKDAKTATVIKILKTPYGRAEKHFVYLIIHGKSYFADFVTGTLYESKTGMCLATHRMEIVEDDGSDEILRLEADGELLES